MADREKLIDVFCSVLGVEPDYNEDAIQFVDDLIANGVTIQRWIPVTERLPKPYTDVLSYAGYGTLYEVDGVDEKGNWVNSYISKYPVTHWMPLPEPPKGE